MTSGATSEPPAATSDDLLPEVRRAIELELDAICNDALFCASQRNCAFLRFVVEETLAGRATEIKERTLGKELFGRPITYDTGSDAVVRVRANEVRKRLGSYYEEHESRAGWRIRLPLRTSVPAFLPDEMRSPVIHTAAGETSEAEEGLLQGTQTILTLPQMMIPTLIALFLCIATFRWQVFSGTPYLDFWETFLAGDAGIALILDADPVDARAVTTDDLKLIGPILQTAAAFHANTQVESDADIKQGMDRLVPIHITHRSLMHEDSQSAYVTVVPGSHPELWIGSKNDAALELAIHSLANSDIFPPTLEIAIRRKTPSRLRFTEKERVTMQTLPAGEQTWRR
jgi:hypothetical protein